MPKAPAETGGGFWFKFSPMLRTELIKKLRPLVGIRADMNAPELAAELKALNTPRVLLTLDQCHELLQLSTLKMIAPETGDGEQFAKWLSQSIDDAIAALLSNLDTRFTEAGLSPQLLTSKSLFRPVAGRGQVIIPSSRVVGLQIAPTRADVVMMLERLSFFGVFPAAGFKIRLLDMDTGDETDISPLPNRDWVDVGQALLPDHTYQVVYDESDLGAEGVSFNTVATWPGNHGNCKSCAVGCVTSFSDVDAIAIVGNQDPITSQDTNFGINLTLSAAGDVSGRLIADPGRVLTALKYQVAVSFLSKIAYSKRHNGDTEESKNGALYALSDETNADRVTLRLDRALASLVKALVKEAGESLDNDDTDEVGWGTV